jgi:hypothetical protein
MHTAREDRRQGYFLPCTHGRLRCDIFGKNDDLARRGRSVHAGSECEV